MTVWVVVGAVSALVFLQLQCSGAENCPITIGAYGEGGAPIDNDGQGIWYQDYGGAPDSTTHVYHGWVFPAVLLYDAARLGSHIHADQVPEISGRGIATDGIKG